MHLRKSVLISDIMWSSIICDSCTPLVFVKGILTSTMNTCYQSCNREGICRSSGIMSAHMMHLVLDMLSKILLNLSGLQDQSTVTPVYMHDTGWNED